LYVSTALARGSRAATSQSVTGWSSPTKQGYVPQKGTDYKDGLDGLETYTGYVYYTSITSSKPGPPSGGDYYISSQAASGYSAGWSNNPPDISGSQASVWYCQWTAKRTSKDATTAPLTFHTVFQGVNFKGLVTFSAIADSLGGELNGTSITQIDGGKIETGSIVVNKLQSGKQSISGTSNFSFGLGTSGAGTLAQFTGGSRGLYSISGSSLAIATSIV
jgi:hypothetical protein